MSRRPNPLSHPGAPPSAFLRSLILRIRGEVGSAEAAPAHKHGAAQSRAPRRHAVVSLLVMISFILGEGSKRSRPPRPRLWRRPKPPAVPARSATRPPVHPRGNAGLDQGLPDAVESPPAPAQGRGRGAARGSRASRDSSPRPGFCWSRRLVSPLPCLRLSTNNSLFGPTGSWSEAV